MNKFVVRSYIYARPKTEGGETHCLDVTGVSSADKSDIVVDLKIMYPDNDIYDHPECYHEYRGTRHLLANKKCGPETIL